MRLPQESVLIPTWHKSVMAVEKAAMLAADVLSPAVIGHHAVLDRTAHSRNNALKRNKTLKENKKF